jgi:hypothetical protein
VSAALVLVHTDRRHILHGRAAEMVEEIVRAAETIERLHTGRVIFHVSQGSLALEFCFRAPPRKRTAPLSGPGPLTLEEAAAVCVVAVG